PLSGRGAQQETGRHLLAAGRFSRRFQHRREHRDLALSPALRCRGVDCGAAGFRDRQRLVFPQRRGVGAAAGCRHCGDVVRRLAGIIFMAVAIIPWLVAIESATGGTFLAGSLGQDLWAKLVGAQESHGAPPLSYLLMGVATFWPGSVMLVPALVHAWRHHGAP